MSFSPSATLAATLSLNSTTSWLTSANCRRSARVPVAQRHAVEQDLAAGGLDEARQQVDQRALAGARRADQGHRLAGGDVQRPPGPAPARRRPRGSAGHAAQLDLAAARAGRAAALLGGLALDEVERRAPPRPGRA
jgi:hypothetical protein